MILHNHIVFISTSYDFHIVFPCFDTFFLYVLLLWSLRRGSSHSLTVPVLKGGQAAGKWAGGFAQSWKESGEGSRPQEGNPYQFTNKYIR